MHDATSENSAPVERVSTLELFFDLVFVFAITQLSHVFGHAHSAIEFLRAFLVLAIVWWMYGGYAWLTSNVRTDRFAYRLFLLCAMAAFLVIALRIPSIATRHGPALGIAYLVVVLVHAAMFMHAPNSSARAILGILPFNLTLGLLVLASGLVNEAWNWVPWAAAALPIVATTVARRERDFQLSPTHFVERHGLVVLIAIGESVVATGAGAAELPIGIPLLTAVVLGLALAAALWWSYFDRDDARAEHAMTHASGPERARMALYGYYHAHLLMIAGIVVAAAGVHEAVAEIDHAATAATAALVSGGVAVYLIGGAAFRWLFGIGTTRARLVTAAVVAGIAPLGVLLGSLMQLALVVLAVVVMLLAERRLDGAGRGGQ